jgi:hypothetical protein
MNRRLAKFLFLVAAVASWACGGGGGGGTPSVKDPAITSFAADKAAVVTGTTTNLTAVFTDGTGSIDNGVGAVTSGVAKATSAIAADTTFTLTVTGNGKTVTKAVAVTTAAAPAKPVITAPNFVVAGGTGSASVPAAKGVSFAWTISGGTFTGGGTTATGTSVGFTAGAVGTLHLSCQASSAAWSSAQTGTKDVTVVEEGTPIINAPEFVVTGSTGNTASVDDQTGDVTFTWTITTGGTIVGTASGLHLTSITYTATAAAGGTVHLHCVASNPVWSGPKTGDADVTAVLAPFTPSITAPANVTTGHSESASVTAQTGVTFAWTITGGTFVGGTTATTASGTSVNFTAGAVGTLHLTCQANSTAWTSTPAAGTADVNVVAAPVATSLTALFPAVSYGGRTPLIPVFSNGTGAIDDGSGTLNLAVLSDVEVNPFDGGPGELTENTTYTLTVTNAAGDTAQATAQVTVSAQTSSNEITFTTTGSTFAPVIRLKSGATATISWSFSDGSSSNSETPSVDFGSPGTRVQRLSLDNWPDLQRINLGSSGTSLEPNACEAVVAQNVSAVTGLDLVRPTLGQWCSAGANTMTSFDFSNFPNLDRIDVDGMASLASLNVMSLPTSLRILAAGAGLTSLDVSYVEFLSELSLGLNPLTDITFGDFTYSGLERLAAYGDPAGTATPFASPDVFATTARFPNLFTLSIYAANQSGALRVPATPEHGVLIEASYNQYDTLDLTGALGSNTAFGDVYVSHNVLTSVDITECTQITHLELIDNQLDSAQLDAILAQLDGAGREPGAGDPPGEFIVALDGNACPHDATSIASLAGKGWTMSWTEDSGDAQCVPVP